MTMSDVFLQELEQEAHATRRALERVPENKLDWRPHPKSMSLGQLSLHIAVMPGAIAELSTQSPFQVKNFTQEPATSTSQLLSTLVESLAKARQVLKNTDDAALGTMWRMVDGEKEIMAIPRAALLRTSHAESLVSPPGSADSVSPRAWRARSVDLWTERGREPVCDGARNERNGVI